MVPGPSGDSWAFTRDPLNDLRGDDDDGFMLESVTNFGLMNMGHEAFLFTSAAVIRSPMGFTVMHMARRLVNLGIAYAADTAKEISKVQPSVARGIRSRIYTKEMPDDLQTKLKELANIANEVVTHVTILEKIRSAPMLQEGLSL